MRYQPRIIDIELDELIQGLPAIAIDGPKAVGKTETALRRANTFHRLDDPGQLEVVQAAPERLVQGDPPMLIDEWQRFPPSWDLVRRSVDADSTPGRFLLTGSATPTEAPTHSGAGRIVSLRMRPMSLAERSLTEATVRLADLLTGKRPPLSGSTSVGLAEYTAEILASGFPAIRRNEGRALRAQLDGYLTRIVEHDFVEAGHTVRSPAALRSWLTAYAAATSTTASFEVIRDASSAGETTKLAKTTTAPLRATLEGLWMIEPLPAWSPSRNRLRRLAQSPVHHLTDPALAARLLGATAETLLEGQSSGPAVPRDGTLLGALFESLVTLSVRTYAQVNEAQVRHLRSRGGEHEIDLIVERSDGRVLAVEVKLSANVRDNDLRHLKWLASRIGDDLLDAIVVTTGTDAYRRSDGIGVVPAALLSY